MPIRRALGQLPNDARLDGLCDYVRVPCVRMPPVEGHTRFAESYLKTLKCKSKTMPVKGSNESVLPL